MNIRRILYITILGLIVAFLYYNGQQTAAPLPETKDQKSVLSAFKDQSSLIPEDLRQANYHLTDIYFPGDYEGSAGDEFYVSLAQDKQFLTLKYVIRSADNDTKLEYYCKDRWKQFKPPTGKFEQYQMQDGRWTSI
ncbi:MAG TPA: hypothetical protein VHQ70_11300 [Syntrophomonadaceae bacterium]|nr:hypothetical protein [Syntrophomonadaceae bacterium]